MLIFILRKINAAFNNVEVGGEKSSELLLNSWSYFLTLKRPSDAVVVAAAGDLGVRATTLIPVREGGRKKNCF